ncbi:hypothetical protein KHC33_10760 [Methanospirillum sp. J.3.6.1-F.2.7.3]|uniref:Uncharacterized protein n=1 Tax=Methanospirillum purgamenti TaxID=2834276 RepID=A0A8E7EGG3_9EURY|nr:MULTISPECIES: hypothetical protein [Methanospirillum]MDX8551697.1 hypothetical protein [Methanospirillum hungatei]QVV87822.1 hypothetical protein KHC33_10760 [Methanospirillum sp. J.3.6.1-F.2.7.3]
MPFMMPFFGFPIYYIIGIMVVCAIIMLLMMLIMRRVIMRGGCCPCCCGPRKDQNEQKIMENQWYR